MSYVFKYSSYTFGISKFSKMDKLTKETLVTDNPGLFHLHQWSCHVCWHQQKFGDYPVKMWYCKLPYFVLGVPSTFKLFGPWKI